GGAVDRAGPGRAAAGARGGTAGAAERGGAAGARACRARGRLRPRPRRGPGRRPGRGAAHGRPDRGRARRLHPAAGAARRRGRRGPGRAGGAHRRLPARARLRGRPDPARRPGARGAGGGGQRHPRTGTAPARRRLRRAGPAPGRPGRRAPGDRQQPGPRRTAPAQRGRAHRRHPGRAAAVGAGGDAGPARGAPMSNVAAAHWQEARNLRLAERLRSARPNLPSLGLAREGVLRRAVGLTLAASGCSAPLGSRCRVETAGGRWVDTEVVGFSGDRTFLMPTADLEGLLPNARVVPSRRRGEVAVGEGLLGRVIDSDGVPLDGRGPIRAEQWAGLAGAAINPLMREPITQSLDVGVRAINAMLPIGRGQRIGLFAGSGVGKSTLLGMMTRFTAADVIVVGLIGERGREVRDFVEWNLGQEGLRRSVVVAAPADRPRLARLHGALCATAIAEYYRDQGLHVLLLMDSLTRFAHAQREIGLSVGEPPTTRGYPPSVF